MTTLTLEDFMKYKYVKTNEEMLPQILEFYNANKQKFQRVQNNNTWRKFEQKATDNWLVSNKFTQNDEDKLFSQFRSILNKLSDANFDDLAKELIGLELSKQTHLSKLVELIFNKAIIENTFAAMYAKLAKELASYYIKEVETGKDIFFRQLLINKCQLMFNNCLLYDPIHDNKTLITKEMAIGCMVFIGELYNIELLTNKIISSCFAMLIGKIGQNKSLIVECLAVLLKTVAPIYSMKFKSESTQIFDEIKNIVKTNETMLKKDKFVLMDLLDMQKANGW